MTIEEFFNMNVGDKFKVSNTEYVVVDTFLNGSTKCINYKMSNDNFNKVYMLIQLFVCVIGIHFITLAQKLPSKTPIENVQEKINQLKLELSKLEDEKKSLEIQVGKFYEIMYSDCLYKKTETFFIKKIEGNIYRIMDRNGSIICMIKDNIISYKKIEDISVLEETWKNV